MHRNNTSLTVVRHSLPHSAAHGREIPVHVDRWQLAKLRWRAEAEDGRDFGIEVEEPLHHGDIVCTNDYSYYVIDQLPETVLVVKTTDAEKATRIAWSIGNLHQLLQINSDELISADDPSLRQLFDQLHIEYKVETRRFEPMRSAIGHHHHSHSH